MTINIPIVNEPNLYADNLQLAWASVTTLTVAAGQCRDSTNINDIILDAAVTINGAANGANGLDQGSLANNTMYAVWMIGDSFKNNDAAAVISTDTSAPLLPSGYDMYRRIGWVLTDGSAQFLLFWQIGDAKQRMYWYDVGISELSAGNATTYTAIDLATSVPPIETEVLLNVAYTPASATNVAHLLPYGSSATNGIVQFGYGVAAAQKGMARVPARLNSAVPTIQYKVANGSDALTLLVQGYIDNI